MSTDKIQLNEKQTQLANYWLGDDCYAYAYSIATRMLWFKQLHYSGHAINNARKLTEQQLQQLQQLS